MLKLAGSLLLALGFAMGAFVALAPFRVGPIPTGFASLAIFTLLTLGGYLLVALDARTAVLPALARVVGSLFMTLAVAAAAALVAVASAIVSVPPGGLASLWYVLLVGAAVGTASLLSNRPVGEAKT